MIVKPKNEKYILAISVQATLWSFFQRGGTIIVSFISNLILARILFPEDYGIIGLILVFTSLADTFVDGGLSSALIQRKTISKNDISTAFTSNLIVSIVLYGMIFILSPTLARYFNIQNFDLYVRVQSLTVIFRAFYVVEFSMLNRNLQFKKLARINIVSSLLSAIAAIGFASFDYGIWSLIIKNITLQLMLVILYKHFVKLNITLGWNKESFLDLIGFGGLVSLTYLLDFVYTNVLSFFLGRNYSVKDLGYYSQANSLEQVPVTTLSLVVNQVMFPFISKIQNEKDKVVKNTRKSVTMITFLIFPILFFLIYYAYPVIALLYSDKWLPSVPYFQILCFGGLINALIHANRSVLKSMGRTQLLFVSQLITVSLGFVLLFIGLNYRIEILLILVVSSFYLNYFLVAFFNQIATGYTIWNQISDLLHNLIFSIIAITITYVISKFIILPNFYFLFLVFVIFYSLYLLFHFMFRTKSFLTIKEIFIRSGY